MNCNIGIILPESWDEPEAPSQALQLPRGGWVGGEKKEESKYVNLFDFYKRQAGVVFKQTWAESKKHDQWH